MRKAQRERARLRRSIQVSKVSRSPMPSRIYSPSGFQSRTFAADGTRQTHDGNLRADKSAMTGESAAVDKYEGDLLL